MEHELRSPLSVAECARRLAERLQANPYAAREREKPLSGWVRERRVSLRLARGARNPFVPHFQGRLEPAARGTVLRGRFELHPAAKGAAVAWALLWSVGLCGLTAIAEVVMISFLAAFGEQLRALGPEEYQALMGIPAALLSLPLLGVAVGLGFPALFIVVRRGDRARILALLKRVLEAQERSKD